MSHSAAPASVPAELYDPISNNLRISAVHCLRSATVLSKSVEAISNNSAINNYNVGLIYNIRRDDALEHLKVVIIKLTDLLLGNSPSKSEAVKTVVWCVETYEKMYGSTEVDHPHDVYKYLNPYHNNRSWDPYIDHIENVTSNQDQDQDQEEPTKNKLSRDDIISRKRGKLASMVKETSEFIEVAETCSFDEVGKLIPAECYIRKKASIIEKAHNHIMTLKNLSDHLNEHNDEKQFDITLYSSWRSHYTTYRDYARSKYSINKRIVCMFCETCMKRISSFPSDRSITCPQI